MLEGLSIPLREFQSQFWNTFLLLFILGLFFIMEKSCCFITFLNCLIALLAFFVEPSAQVFTPCRHRGRQHRENIFRTMKLSGIYGTFWIRLNIFVFRERCKVNSPRLLPPAEFTGWNLNKRCRLLGWQCAREWEADPKYSNEIFHFSIVWKWICKHRKNIEKPLAYVSAKTYHDPL